jgi:hypothetical protein
MDDTKIKGIISNVDGLCFVGGGLLRSPGHSVSLDVAAADESELDAVWRILHRGDRLFRGVARDGAKLDGHDMDRRIDGDFLVRGKRGDVSWLCGWESVACRGVDRIAAGCGCVTCIRVLGRDHCGVEAGSLRHYFNKRYHAPLFERYFLEGLEGCALGLARDALLWFERLDKQAVDAD